MSWRDELEGPTWVPVLNAAEDRHGIPRDLLARVAYQESRFRPDIIAGTTKSPAGAVGLMQLEPAFYPDAGKDTAGDIESAAMALKAHYTRFQDWQVALAAYNWGEGNVHKCLAAGGSIMNMPTQTEDYVVQICADVPVLGSLV